MATLYGPPSDGSLIPHELEEALATLRAFHNGERLAAELAGRLSEPAPGVTVGTMIPFATPSATSIGSVSFTTATQAITVSVAHGLKVGDRVGFVGVSGAAGIDGNTDYYVRTVPTATTLTLSTTVGGAAVYFSADGAAAGLYRRAFAWDRKNSRVYDGMRVTEGRAVQSTSIYPQYDHIKADPSVLTYAPGILTGTALRLTFDFNGDRLDLLPWQGGSNSGRILVDGREAGGWDQADFTAAGVSGWRGRLPLTFADARRRTIEIVLESASDIFGGFESGAYPLPTFPYSASPKGARCLYVGDSFTEGTGKGAGWGWVRWCSELLGQSDAWRVGSGSTGYVQDGTRLALIDRYQNDILAQNPDMVVIALGINDGDAWSANPQTVMDAAATVWDAVLAEPAIRQLVIVGPFPNGGGTGVAQRYKDMDAAFSDMARDRGVRYVSPIREGWTFTLSDGTHPDMAGHEKIGRLVAGHLFI